MNESRTVELMITLYCRGRHHTVDNGLCSECRELLDYSLERLENCPLQPGKPVCSSYRIHCCKPEMRERIRQVMRYSGPRMLRHHPAVAVQYLLRKMMKK